MEMLFNVDFGLQNTASPGRHCHSTSSLTAVDCHSLGIYILILLLLLSLAVKMTVSPMATPTAPAEAPARKIRSLLSAPGHAGKTHSRWPEFWVSFRPLIGISSQTTAGPARGVWDRPVNFRLWAVERARFSHFLAGRSIPLGVIHIK
jgi:hypothetical protein